MRNFCAAEQGAVTVDWVVLTAGLVGLGFASMAVVSTGVQDSSTDVNCQLHTNMIQASFSNQTISYDFSGGCMGGLQSTHNATITLVDDTGSDGEAGYILFDDFIGEDYIEITDLDPDMSALFGGTISWDVKAIEGTPNAAHYNSRPLVSIKGTNGQRIDYTGSAADLADPSGAWTTVFVNVDDTSGWTINGNPVSEIEMRDVLSDVEFARIQVEQTAATTNEQVGFDGLTFTNGS